MPKRGNLADQIAEPADGTRLFTIEVGGLTRAIWRDDKEAAGATYTQPGEHWFVVDDSDPMGWHEVLKYTKTVYQVADKPLAEL